MEGHASISPDVLARYAADAALEVDGVHALVESHLPRPRGVGIAIGGEGRAWGARRGGLEWGSWATGYYHADGRLLASTQYGPSGLFPRANQLPAGPPSPEAVLVTCAYVVDSATPWVMQSLFLAAIGDARDRGAKALEAFAYRYPEGETHYERFRVHRTVFPTGFLADFGFRTVRSQGRVELARLDLGGLEPVPEPL